MAQSQEKPGAEVIIGLKLAHRALACVIQMMILGMDILLLDFAVQWIFLGEQAD